MTDTLNLETKVAGGETSRAISELCEAFEAFKETNEDRLRQIETRGAADALTSEKLARIEEKLDTTKRTADTLALKSARPPLAVSAHDAASVLAHKSAFETYVRKGESGRLSQLEEKALSVGSGQDGGYLVPSETEAAVNRSLKAISPIRSIAGIRQVSGSVYKRPFATSGADTGWVGETAARPQTNTPVLAELQFPTMELYAMPAATQTLLDDNAVNLDQWIAQEVETVFAEQESDAFVNGNGTNKPRGFMAYTFLANASWTWGNVGYIATGVAGGFAATNPSDKLVDVIYALKAGYRQNGTWIMNRATQAAIRKFKDSAGNYLWQPAATADGNATLMNFRVMESEYMPDIGTDTHALSFGDFKRGYLIVDRVGVRLLRDPYSSKPYVLFYTTKRVGGGIQNFEAIKTLKFGVS